MRKLARIVRVDEIIPIAGADAIELAKVGGWQCVVRKGAFAAGDLGVYFEIDSVLPEGDARWADFLKRSTRQCWTESGVSYRGHLVRTIKLRGALSQGLLLSLESLGVSGAEGDDMTETLGVAKWEAPPAKGKLPQAGAFPVHLVPKTDAERVQNLDPKWYASLNRDEWYATEKIDGTSLTVARELDGTLRVCSRNWEIQEGDNTYWNAARLIVEYVEPGMAVQAEIYGPGIQGNPLHKTMPGVAVFSVFANDQYLPRDQWPPGIFVWVEAVKTRSDLRLPDTIEGAIAQANGLESWCSPGHLMEGIVWHHLHGKRFQELGGRSAFKVINNQWLLEQK